MEETLGKLDRARTELLSAREDFSAIKQYHLAGELSAVVMILDELDRLLVTGRMQKKGVGKATFT